MSVTFGRLGRAFLYAAAGSGLALLVALLVTQPGRNPLVLVLAILTIVGFALGTVFTVIQRLMFGSPAALQRVATSGMPAQAMITSVDGSSGQINADPIMRLRLSINGQDVRGHVRVPIQRIATMRTGAALPVRVDPSNPKVFVVNWEQLP